MELTTLSVAKGYTDETVIGGGAIKGKNCKIQSITDIEGGHKVTFSWTLDDDVTVLTSSMNVMDGAEGPKGNDGAPGADGIGIKNVTITNGHLIITYTDDTTQDAGVVSGSPTFSGLTDVSISNIQNGQIPKWNSSTSKWENANESGGGGGGGQSYSTSEQIVGTWIDGSTLYQRTYDCGALPNKSSDLTVPHNISDLDKFVRIYGVAMSESMFFNLPHVANSSINDQITLFTDETNITVRVGKNRSEYNAYVTLQYTKATV